jgi:hypothetical protein
MTHKRASHFAVEKGHQDDWQEKWRTKWTTASACIPREVKERLKDRINISKTVCEFLTQLDRELSERKDA